MKFVGGRFTRYLSPGMVGVLFLCHVLGTLCLMVPPSVTAAPTIQNLHVEHVMAGDRRCSDLVTSSAERMDTAVALAIAPTLTLSAVIFQVGMPCDDLIWGPQKMGVPLYTLLSTFRI